MQGTFAAIPCCMCGVPIEPNAANMCANCIRSRVDISEGIPKQLSIHFCVKCERYHQPPKNWVVAPLESKELLVLCIKKVRGLNKVKLIDAGFIWTEPHSRRLKIKLTIQKEVFNGTILQQVFVVEFVVQTMQCPDCTQMQSANTWKAVVQCRQKVEHRRTFLLLEQLILKHNAQVNVTNIREVKDGVDFYYSSKNHATKFVDFLTQMAPLRSQASERLISSDANSNTYNYKWSFSVEIVPVCKDDLVCMPVKLSGALGGFGPMALCARVSNILHFINPLNLQVAELRAQQYWAQPFRACASTKQMTEFVVIDIELCGPSLGKFLLADVQVARVADFGVNDTQLVARTHLGHLLNPGDHCMGYDLRSVNFVDGDIKAMRGKQMPDVFLAKKHYPKRYRKARRRMWKLNTLAKDMETDQPVQLGQNDIELFMQELEEDPELRSKVNIFKDDQRIQQLQQHMPQDSDDDDEGADAPEIGLEELLDELTINDVPPGLHDLEDEGDGGDTPASGGGDMEH